MSERRRNNQPICYVEFRVHDQERFTILTHFFKTLRRWTQQLNTVPQSSDITTPTRTPSRPKAKEETQEATFSHRDQTRSRYQFSQSAEWLLALRPNDLKHLGMPSHAEAVQALNAWQGLSRRERRKAIKAQPNKSELQMLADFADMLRYWQEVEYVLISCEQNFDLGRIEYSTYSFPFGGKAALEELLLFFGFFSIVRDSC